MILLDRVTKVHGCNKDVKLCEYCGGTGTIYTEIGFGDLSGDERLIECRKCVGSGRTVTLDILGVVTVPFNDPLVKDFDEKGS